MGYDAKVIAAQLRLMQPDKLESTRQAWADSTEMGWLIDREKAFRARWPDEHDPSPVRAQELINLLACLRTRADFCVWADTPPRLTCGDCPYAPPPSGWQAYMGDYAKEFYDVRTRDGQEYARCWPNDGQFHARTGHVLDEKDVMHYRLAVYE